MENLDLEWVEELRRQLHNHIFYAPLESHREALEPDFRKAMAQLPPESRRDIEVYLHALQQLDVQLTHMAYETGIQVGQRRARQSADRFPQHSPSPVQLSKVIVETAQRAQDDPHYSHCLTRAEQLEPQYQALHAALSPEQQQLLTEYHAVTKELYELLVYTACKMRR